MHIHLTFVNIQRRLPMHLSIKAKGCNLVATGCAPVTCALDSVPLANSDIL